MPEYWLLGGVAGTLALIALGWFLRGYEVSLLQEHNDELQAELAHLRAAAKEVLDSDRAALVAASEPDARKRGLLLLGGEDGDAGPAGGPDGDPEGQAQGVEA